jgi:hypothetical protein
MKVTESYMHIANIQKDKIINMLFVNNPVSEKFNSDNFWRLLTKGKERGFLNLLMKRNKQIANKANTVLLK